MDSFETLSLFDILAGLRRADFSALEVTQAALARIERLEAAPAHPHHPHP